MKDNTGFETKLARLEEIVSQMEKGQLQLHDSLKLFEEGVKISRECQKLLNAAEIQVKKLTGFDENGNPVSTAFNPEEE